MRIVPGKPPRAGSSNYGTAALRNDCCAQDLVGEKSDAGAQRMQWQGFTAG